MTLIVLLHIVFIAALIYIWSKTGYSSAKTYSERTTQYLQLVVMYLKTPVLINANADRHPPARNSVATILTEDKDSRLTNERRRLARLVAALLVQRRLA